MSDEITPAPLDSPAVEERPHLHEKMQDAGYTETEAQEVISALANLGKDSIPDDSAPLPYAGGTEIPEQNNSDVMTTEQRILGQLQMLNMKVDALTQQNTAIIGRIDWIAPRVEWIRSTFSGLIDQFGKITPGQVFSMLRGKSPAPQEGSAQS